MTARRSDRWTPEVIARLGTVSDTSIAAELGVTRECVRRTRAGLGIGKHGRHKATALVAEAIALLGSMPDNEIARRFGLRNQHVGKARRARGIPSFTASHPVQCGTRAKYNQGCRCVDCKRVHADHMKAWIAKNPDKFQANRDRARQKVFGSAPHTPGKVSNYSIGCRCDGCHEAMRVYNRARSAAARRVRETAPAL